MAEENELDKIQPKSYFQEYRDNPAKDAPPPRNPLAMRKYTPAGPSATSYNPNSYNPAQSRPQSGVVRTGPTFNYTERTGMTAGPVENFQRQPDGSITRNGVTVRPPRVSAPQNPIQTPRSTAGDFSAAAQQPGAQGQQSQVSRIVQVDRQAEQAAQAQEQKRQEAAKQANISVGEAFNEALAKYRDDTTAIVRNGRERVVEYDDKGRPLIPGVNGYEAKYQDSQNRYRIGALRPETIRALNQQRSALGLKTTDSIVGIYATSGVDANGKPTGEPQIVTRYRSADGRIHSKVYTYQEAARFVRGTMGESGDANADDRFASMKQWQDADGNDALGITRTAEYQGRMAKREADSLKNQQTRQQLAQGKATFEQQQADRAKTDRNRPVTEAKAEVDRLDKLAAAEKDEAAKQNWIDQANKARKVLADRQAEAMFADITDATEEGASPANMPQFVKKNGKLVLKDGWMMKKQANGKSSIVPKPGWMLGENGEIVKKPQKPATPQPPSMSSAPTANPPAQPTKGGELDYDDVKMQAQVKRDIESGGGKYEIDTETGRRTVTIGNWDYLSDADKKAMPETQRDGRGLKRKIDIKAIHAMQKKANAAKAEFDKKRKAEEDRFRATLRGQGMPPETIEAEVRDHMNTWDVGADPRRKRSRERMTGFFGV